jgi:serine/threonine-protein kinase
MGRTPAPTHRRAAPAHHPLALAALTVLASVRLATAQCPDGTPPPCARPAPRPAVPTANSVAVLYFDNLSRDTSDAYLADGLTEELIARLGQVERLQVKSRNAVRRYRGQAADDPAGLGRALGVAHLVSGSLRRAGREVRVTVELTRASTGLRLWGDQFDRADTNLLAIEADVASAVAAAIAGRLLPRERDRTAAQPTRNPAAYDQMLRGNFYLAQRNPASVRRAIDAYEAAARLDPTYADALARVAYAFAVFLDWDWVWPQMPADTILSRGLRAAAQALALDPAEAEAWMARGYLLFFRNARSLEGVREAFERASTLAPRNAEVHHQFGRVLVGFGTDSLAAAEYQRALALEPERPITLRNLGLLAWHQHDYQRARHWLDSALTVDPSAGYVYLDRARVLLWLGDTAAARADVDAAERQAAQGYVSSVPGVRVAVQAAEGDAAGARAGAERISAALPASGPVGLNVGLDLAIAWMAVGERSRALDLIERLQPRGARLWFQLLDPGFDGVRTDPRFRRVLDETQWTGAAP